jgi:endonuclease/exonuclease/phosphatase family metal-dependent hydrolase
MQKRFVVPFGVVALVSMLACGETETQAAGANAALTGDAVLLNEVIASHTGTDDTEFVELFGTPGTSLDGLSFIAVESDETFNGTIDGRIDFGSDDTLGDTGFFLIGNPTGLVANYGVTPDIEVSNNFLENSSATYALVETASISGTSVTGSEVVLDAVASTDGDPVDAFFFGAPVIGPDGSFFPAGVRRVTDGIDTDTEADWIISDFNFGPDNTPTPSESKSPPPVVAATIPEIQGAGHVSPLVGERVTTRGVVTAVAFNGYYVQDPHGDGNDDTSDGMFVLQFGDLPSVGDAVELTGVVEEDIPGGAGTGNLSITRMSFPERTTVSQGNDVPHPVVIGRGGRIPPNVIVISEDETDPPINLQDPADAAVNRFNPDVDGIDFYESLEGMIVTVQNPVAVSAIRQFSPFSAEVFVLADDGADAAPADARTGRGGINLQPDPDNRGDQNPERVQIQFDATLFGSSSYPAIKVGDQLDSVTGVVGYSFGNFEVNALGPFDIHPSAIGQEVTKKRFGARLTVASYNVLNLSAVPADDAQRAEIAGQIVESLRSPDVIALQEIQDNNGDIGDCEDEGRPVEECAGELDATETLQALVDAIEHAGGPTYAFFTVDPLVETTDDNRDDPDTFGGISLGNIRNAFLYNPHRVRLVSFEGLTRDVLAHRGVSVPNAFDTSRNPLEAIFRFRGREVTIINNHFSSRFGSTPIFGGPQPFVQAAEDAREAQSLAMNEVTRRILDHDRHAPVIVLGDLNTFEFTNDLKEILPGVRRHRILYNLIGRNFGDDEYTFIFEGNSQVLDHIFVTRNLLLGARYDFVHVNVDFPRLFTSVVGSDHEPILASLFVPRPRRW